ncbi:MAG: pilus assembly protein PilM [Planctomycetota bacterium]
MARAVGLHISKDFVRAAEIEGSAKKLRVKSFVDLPVEVPEGTLPEDAVASTLERLFRDHKFPRSPVALGLDSDEAMFRDLTVPFVRDDHLRRTLKYELETHVHSHNPDEIVVDYVLLGRNDKESRVFVSALPKTLVGGRLKQLDRLRVDPVFVDLDTFGLVSALGAAGALVAHPNGVAVHIDGARARFVVIEGGKLRSARTILLPAGEDGPPSARIAQELVRTIFQAAPKAPPGVVWLTGDASGDPGLRAAVEERVGVPCKPLDLLAGCGVTPAKGTNSARAAVPVGLALRALTGQAEGLDFRKEEFAYEKRFDAIKQALVSTASFLFVMLGLLFIYFRARAQQLDDMGERGYLYSLAEVHDRLNLNPQVSKGKDPAGREIDTERPIVFAQGEGVFNRINKRRIELVSGRGGNSAVTRSATRYWADLWQILGAALVEERKTRGSASEPWLKVYTLNIKVDPPSRSDDKGQTSSIRLSGEVSDVSVFSSLIKKLNESGKFTNVRMPTTTEAKFSDWTIPVDPSNQ